MASQTRQTDTTSRASCWSITAFNEDIPRLEDKTNFPAFVKEVWGGRETAPTTGTLHFQGAVVCNTQVRFSAIKKWLPTAHIEVAIRADALKKYCMKSETAAGPKQVLSNPDKFLKFHEALIMVAEHVDYAAWRHEEPSTWYNGAVRSILMKQPALAGLFANPTMKRFYADTWSVWRHHAEEKRAGAVPPEEHSITPPQGCEDSPEDPELDCRHTCPRTDWCNFCEQEEKSNPIL
nr:MAG: replication associated protein [Cressdnaviricota sp.]